MWIWSRISSICMFISDNLIVPKAESNKITDLAKVIWNLTINFVYFKNFV